MKKRAFIIAAAVFIILLLAGMICIISVSDVETCTLIGKVIGNISEDTVMQRNLEIGVWTIICILGFIITYFCTAKSHEGGRAVIASFLIVIFFPVLIGWGTDFPLEDTENRSMAEKPSLESTEKTEYFSQMDSYLADHVPFRKIWLRNNGLIKYGVFHSSMKILSMPGKNGWIYYGSSGKGEGEDPVADFEKTNLFTDEQLKDLGDSLQGFKNYLTSQGIDFRLMINVNKSHIYPEYLPDEVWEGEGLTRAEQVIEYLKKNTDIEVVYPKDALLANKEKYLLYCPTDAHWNTVGGYIGFTELMKSIDPSFEVTPIEDIDPVYERTNWGDVANIINAAWFTDNQWTTTSYKIDIQTEWIDRAENGHYINNSSGNGQKILVYHDSYMNQMMEYIGKEYSGSEFIEKQFNITESDIEKKAPDVVVFEILERMLNNYMDDLRYWQKYK